MHRHRVNSRFIFSALFICLGMGAVGESNAALAAPRDIAPRRAQAVPDVANDLTALARQQPWVCKTQPAMDAPLRWEGGQARCAWQERLRMRRWEGLGGEAAEDCVSAQAQWWAWARGPRPLPWFAVWPSQSAVDESGPVKRIVIMQSGAQGMWRITEWTWTPSPRAATRRWQEGRWAMLRARAQQLRHAALLSTGTREASMLGNVVLANAGARVAETGNGILNYRSDGLCLQVDAASPGQQLLQVPYSADDSRFEQRAAMQLQLARRYPNAQWLIPFSLVPQPAKGRSGAKFYALWLENTVVNGQLWIPTRGEGPLVRVRITSALPPQRANAAATTQTQHVILRELMGVAWRWTSQHD